MSIARRAWAVTALCFVAARALAQSDADIDRIPQAASLQSSAAQPVNRAVYWQSDLTYNIPRDDLIVPLSPVPAWEARSFLDMRLDQRLDPNFSVAYSGRINVRAEPGLGFPNRENFRSDLRETYAAWTDNQHWFMQLGRINLKSGVAEGFNPTDYFKTRAVVEPTSIDPAVLREDRLGVVMLQTQYVGTSASLTFALAPKLAADSPPYNDDALPAWNPMLDRTNGQWRALFKGSVNLSNGISPELLMYEESGSARFGLNISKGIGRSVVTYLEWSGGRRASLAEAAYEEGRRTDVLPAGPAIPIDGDKGFANDLAAGVSYTLPSGLNLAAEFEYTQAGFSAADWRNWFGAGRAAAPLAGELWFIRAYAGEQQQPVARRSLFLRAYWQNALVKNLNVSAFAVADLHDGSTLAQASVDYYLSAHWTVGAIVDVYSGARQSEFGSLPQRGSALLKIARFF